MPLWSKAPLLLIRYPEILLAVAATAMILAVASAANPLFLSAAGAASIAAQTRDLPPLAAGVRIAQYGTIEGLSLEESTAERTHAIEDLFTGVDGLGDPVVTSLGVTPRLTSSAGGGRTWTVKLVTRTAAIDHVEALTGAPGNDGVWVPDFVADDLNLAPGDDVVLSNGPGRATTQVAGVSRWC
jgi:hypothetical protein